MAALTDGTNTFAGGPTIASTLGSVAKTFSSSAPLFPSAQTPAPKTAVVPPVTPAPVIPATPLTKAPANLGSTKTSQPAVLSSSTIDTKNQDNVSKLSGTAPTGSILGADGFVRNADQSFAEAPSDATSAIDESGNQSYTSGGLRYALGPSGGKISSDPAIQGLYDQFTTLKASMDATSAANIENIKNQYTQLIQEQGRANKSAEAGTYSLLARGGSLQTDSSGGIIQSQVSYGLQQIGDLNNKEQAAIIAAQNAQQDNDFKIMDKQLSIAQQARTEKQAAAQKLNDSIQKATEQTRKDNAIGGILATGVTSPADILAKLKEQGNNTISAKDIADTLSNLNPDQKEIMNVLGEVSKMNAPQDVRTAVAAAKTIGDAYKAAGGYLNDPTSNASMYNAYVGRATAQGLKPMSAEDWLTNNAAKKAAAEQAAKNKSDAAYTASDKVQQSLEQQGRQVIEKEFSARTGALGIENAKVGQANHLNSLFTQYYDPKTGNYNIPTAQYAELAIGLANMLSGTGQSSDNDRAEIKSKTAAGDLKGALQYITGVPQNGNTQAIIKNLVDSVDRQAQTAERNRQAALDDMKAILPTDLEASRKDALIAGTKMVGYEGQSRVSKTAVDAYIKSNPAEADAVAKLYDVPGATDQDIEEYLKAQGKIL